MEEIESKATRTVLEQHAGHITPPPYNSEIIDGDLYKTKFADVGNNKVVSTVTKESRRCIKLNDKTTAERGVFIGIDGKSVFSFNGKNYSADYGKFNFSQYKENSLVLVHNHPNSQSFSVDDILTVSNHPQIKTIVAAGHDGTVYALSIGEGKRIDNNLRTEYNNVMKALSGDIHLTLLTIAEKYGWRYSKR